MRGEGAKNMEVKKNKQRKRGLYSTGMDKENGG